jgi:glucose-6-phosphate 1-dehydrogenase
MSTVIVIFGATGDLTAKKLIPALFSNYRKHRLPDNTEILGVARKNLTDVEFRQKMCATVTTASAEACSETEWEGFAQHLYYHPGDLEKMTDLTPLKQRIEELGGREGNYLFYLATAPQLYSVAIAKLGAAGLTTPTDNNGYRRVVIEKPFGRDLESCRSLNREILQILREDQIFHIDHYLGKDTVQNVLIFRFGNAIFEPLWNRNYIDHVQITVAESMSIGHRAGYYESAGALRDMFQNHLLQLVTLVAMEPPALLDADSLRDEKVKVLMSLRDIAPEHSALHTVRAQYDGYRSEEGVAADSTTETFAAIRLYIDNWRWQGVPFYLRSGKLMKENASEIIIQFRRPPTQIFDTQTGSTELYTNRLSICIQPDEGIHLRFITKQSDQGMKTHPVTMDFQDAETHNGHPSPGAYERLLLDAMNGDASLFTRSDEIELAWRFIDGIEAAWQSDYAPPLQTYAPHTWGPTASDDMLGRDGHWWILTHGEQ